MDSRKYTMNSFVLTVILFSAIFLFFTVTVSDMADTHVINENYPLEDTGYYIRYTTHIPSGIYDGEGQGAHLLLEGSYGHDWGAYVSGDTLYCNEYHTTTLGYMTTNVVKINLKDFSKEVLYEDCMVRGVIASGELLLYDNVVMPNWFPKSNPLCLMYDISGKGDPLDSLEATVVLYDITAAKEVYRKDDTLAQSDKRVEFYLSKTLQELAS